MDRRDRHLAAGAAASLAAIVAMAVGAAQVQTPTHQADLLSELQNGPYELVSAHDLLYKTADGIRIQVVTLKSGKVIIGALQVNFSTATPQGIRTLQCKPTDPVDISKSIQDFQKLQKMVLKGTAPVTVSPNTENILTIQVKGYTCVGITA